MIVGTYFGRISIYNVNKNGYDIIKFLPYAHNEMVTCISECSLNTKDEILFVTGCYDGTVSVWDLYEKNPIFSY